MKNLNHCLLLLAVSLLGGVAVFAQTAQKPNVIFILADNVGYGDLGPYGGGELRGFPTPNTDKLATQGLKLTQFLVEAGCTPSRAALMTGQYSIRNGLSLILIPGSPNTLSGKAYTMGQLFKDAGYATAIYGKWHLGDAKESLPSAHGFDDFYGIPANTSWDDAITVSVFMTQHVVDLPEKDLIEKGPWIMQQKPGGAYERVKPYTPEVRAEIDDELIEHATAFVRAQNSAKKPFFLYLPFSMGHAPNYPSKQFAGKSRVGNYGDKMMEGDYHVGQIMDLLKELNIENNTILVFASDNGPWGFPSKDLGNLGTADKGTPGPFRGELGDVSEGSIRTFCFVRWPGHISPNTSSYAMFSAMDFLPTFASILGAKLPTNDRVIDGVDQTEVLYGKSTTGKRDNLLTFVGPDLLAVRWKQFRVYFTDINPTGGLLEKQGATSVSSSKMYYPRVYNIEMDPHEDLNITLTLGVPALAFAYKPVIDYYESVKKFPNPPTPNMTVFSARPD